MKELGEMRTNGKDSWSSGDTVPSFISLAWLAAETNVFDSLSEYVLRRLLHDPGEQSFEARLGNLPAGLRCLWLVLHLNSEVLNGGFRQFFSNIFLNDAAGHEIVDTAKALRSLRADSLRALFEEAIFVLRNVLPPDVVSAALESPRGGIRERSGIERAPVATQIQAMQYFEERDRRFYELDGRWAGEVAHHIKAHPGEFITRH